MERRKDDRRLLASEDGWMRIERKLIWIERTAADIIGINNVPGSARLRRKQTLDLKIIKDRNVLIGALSLDERWIDQAMTEVAGDALKINELIKRRAIRRHGPTAQPGRGGVTAQTQTKAIGLIKKMLDKAYTSDLAQALNYEEYCQEIAGRTNDYEEGVNAFIEKRKPEFTGN